MLKFKIPYEHKHVVRTTLMPLKFNKETKLWEAEDTEGGRYHAQNAMSKWCVSDTKLQDKNKDRDIVCKFDPWRHQKAAFNVVYNYHNAYIYMLPGVGKSKVIVDYYNTVDLSKTLIVCPKNVIPTWKKQFDMHGTRMRINLVELTKGSSKIKNEIVRKMKTLPGVIFVVNYDTVWRLPELHKINFNLVVFDEIHRLQDSQTNVSKFCKKIKSKKKVGLTGTPGEPKKFHGQFLSLDQNIFGTSKTRFLDKYFNLDYFGNPKSVKDPKLAEHFAIISHIEDNPDMIEIPDAQHIVVDVELKAKQQYKRLENQFLLEVESGLVTPANAMVKTLKLRQICSGFVMDDKRVINEIDNYKEEVVTDMLKDMEGINVVVFYNFKHEAEKLQNIAAKLKRPFGNISGSRRDMHCIDNPQKGTLLAIQIRAGGTGIDGLQKTFDYCFFYSLTWSEIDHTQAIHRLDRAGRDKTAFFYYLITKGTVEEKVYKALKNKKNVLSEVAGIKHEEQTKWEIEGEF